MAMKNHFTFEVVSQLYLDVLTHYKLASSTGKREIKYRSYLIVMVCTCIVDVDSVWIYRQLFVKLPYACHKVSTRKMLPNAFFQLTPCHSICNQPDPINADHQFAAFAGLSAPSLSLHHKPGIRVSPFQTAPWVAPVPSYP